MSHHHWTRVLQNVGVGKTGLNSGDLVRMEWFLLEVTLQMGMLRKLGEREMMKTQPCDKLRVHKAF